MENQDLSSPLLTKEHKIDEKHIGPPPPIPMCTLRDPFFSHINSILTLANERLSIENSDLCELDPSLKARTLTEEYTRLYEVKKSILCSLITALGCLGISMLIMVFISTLLQYADPLILKYMIRTISDKNAEGNDAIYNIIFIALIVLVLRTICEEHAYNVAYLCNCKAINCLFGLLYAKTLRITFAAKSLLGTGKIMNILHGDGKEVANYLHDFNVLWTIPLDIIVSLTLLYMEVGWYAILGAIIIGIGIGVQRIVYGKYTKIRRKMYKYMDNRSKYLNEYLENIKIIKYNAWEDFVYNNIKEARKKETGLNFYADMLKVVNDILIPFLMIMTIMVIYLMEGKALSAEKTFTVLALYKRLETPLSSVAKSFAMYARFRLSLARISLFMLVPESLPMIEENKQEVAGEIHVSKASFAWVDNRTIDHANEIQNLLKMGKKGKSKKSQEPLARYSTAPCLSNITMHIKRGELVAIVGAIGSGKTALMQSLIGELLCLEGSKQIGGRVRFVSQVPWIINSTISENIRISRQEPANEPLYQQVFKSCQLHIDVQQFIEGDKEEIGARGINLSGGQRARIGIARELYAEGDVYLFDDCLSALDPQVASSIFQKVILGTLEGKTRIFVTHSFHLISQATRIIVLKEGSIVEEGSYKELIANKGEFSRLQSGSTAESLALKVSAEEKTTLELQKKEMLSRTISLSMIGKINKNLGETKAVGGISWSYYGKLITMGGVWKFIISIFVFFFVEITTVLIQWWLAMWTSNYFNGTFWYYTAIYAALSILFCISLLLRKLTLAYFQYYLSLQSQLQLVNVLLHTPISWYDYTPIGRIVNRAVKDQSVLDGLGYSVTSACQKGISLLVSIAVIAFITPYFFVLFLILFGFYVYWYSTSIQASRDARRLVSMNHSPMYGIFNEILDGLINIRLANLSHLFLNRQHSYLDVCARSFLFKAYCSRWVNVRISMLGAFAVTGASVFLAFEKDAVLGAVAGFSLLNSISIARKLGQLLLAINDVETNMSSMERVCEYIEENPQERPYDQLVPAEENWPNKGKIEVNSLTIKYQPHLKSALRGLSFTVNPGEKIGVVGRTGSGKSTLTLALLRMSEPHIDNFAPQAQHIIIDGEDVEFLGLKFLRKGIGMIPQEPVLFSGTIRSNLDPFDKYSDAEIVSVLSRVKVTPILKRKVEDLDKIEEERVEGSAYKPVKMQEEKGEEVITDKDMLGLEVRERGDNFSLGERQLICIARALLKNPKILIMDEATASVDEATDWCIQEMIRGELKNTTVIIIAHRLKTILECNRIIVLEKGRLVDFDTPHNLIEKKSGFLYESLQKSSASAKAAS